MKTGVDPRGPAGGEDDGPCRREVHTVVPAAARPAAIEGITPAGTGYTVVGEGEPLVLIHGVGMQRGIWAPQIDDLARTHRVIAYDMLGHGDSRLPPAEPTLTDYAGQLVELLEHLGIRRANVSGHSMGALVALAFALEHPERTLRMATVNAVHQRTPAQRAAVRARALALQQAGAPAGIPATLARWFGDPVPEALAPLARQAGEYLASVDLQGYARTYRLFANADGEHGHRLQELAMPALFLTGSDDTNSLPSMSAAMAEQAPQGVLVVVPEARHMMTMTHAQAVNRALREWLARPAA
ncbi:alpha/beta fold hydrolase [Verticiella sediminum]|uniref:Alpha/beta fold hydrolase n=2 Tax=Verticiella sediminum TaxID=1247510 RepID=A0A556A601_9BURK|nr:alpha/beta fold hydrolase [Verticiella sediminum]